MVCLLVHRNEIAKILHSSIPFNFVFIVFIALLLLETLLCTGNALCGGVVSSFKLVVFIKRFANGSSVDLDGPSLFSNL